VGPAHVPLAVHEVAVQRHVIENDELAHVTVLLIPISTNAQGPYPSA
jgi:hypothetical protein